MEEPESAMRCAHALRTPVCTSRFPQVFLSVLAACAIALLAVLVPATSWSQPARSASGEGLRASSAPMDTAFDDGDPRVVTTAIADRTVIGADGRVRIGVQFQMDAGWHIYWKNPGQAAYESTIEVRIGERESTATDIRWPTPKRFTAADGFITTYGYDDNVVLWLDIDDLEQLSRSPVDVTVVADFLTCEMECIPARTEHTLRLSFGPTPVMDDTNARLFELWEATLPVPVAAASVLFEPPRLVPSLQWTMSATVDACGSSACDLEQSSPVDVEFFPWRVAQWDVTSTSSSITNTGLLELRLAGSTGPDDLPAVPLGGVVVVNSGGRRLGAFELSLGTPQLANEGSGNTGSTPSSHDERSPTGASVDARELIVAPSAGRSDAPIGLLIVLGMALLGGLLLNLMPCVLPVLLLKVGSLLEGAHRERRARIAHAAGYAGGIMVSMLVLAMAVVAMRAASLQTGWGMQFQSPLYLVLVLTLVVTMALNLLDVFQIHGPTVEGGAAAPTAVMEGVLAVALATPCAAPFLGTAVGFALASSSMTIVAVFVSIGVGLALPFTVLALVPGALRWLPRPGPWMVQLRAVLAFGLLGTGIWLCTLLSGHGRLALAAGLGTSLVGGAGVWWIGQRQRTGRSTAIAGWLVPVVCAALGGLGVSQVDRGRSVTTDDAAASGSGSHDGASARWSPRTVAALLADERPVIVDFTADWCITCKVNERLVLRSDAVQQALALYDAQLLVADWTHPDEMIEQELARHGRSGVPMYLVYSPHDTAPVVLPELLTVDRVVRALEEAAQPATEVP